MLTGKRHRGFTYALLLAIVAVIAAASSATISLGMRMERAEAERDLSWVEVQYAAAIAAYARVSPGVAHGPRSLDELLRDPRSLATVRYLRRRYPDPVTMANDWRVFRDPGGWIVAVCRPLLPTDPPSDGANREATDPCAPFRSTPAPAGVFFPD